jgi:hypothetical protein
MTMNTGSVASHSEVRAVVILRMRKHTLVFLIFFSVYLSLPEIAFAITREIRFPVDGVAHFKDDFADPRGGGSRQHLGIDIISEKMIPVVSAVDGVVSYIVSPEASWGYSLSIIDADGYQYKYLHLNNDTPGTDDGRGGEANAYAPGIARDIPVHKGELIGWVGDSGNAEAVGAHLHFEIWSPMRSAVDPYESLVLAVGSSTRITVTDAGMSTKKPEVITVTKSGNANYVFTKKLMKGMKSEEVRQLQLKLQSLGYLKGVKASGYYGALTKTAILALQKKHGLEQTGAVGPKTRTVLNRSA